MRPSLTSPPFHSLALQRTALKTMASTCQNRKVSFRPGALGANELSHNVKRNQIVVGLTIDDRTLVIVNIRIGETSSRAHVI